MSEQSNIIDQAVTLLLEQFKNALPQLSHIAVFLPNSSASQDFRSQLLKQLKNAGFDAVIPPWIGTVKEWVNSSIDLPEPGFTIISEQARRLMFIEALKQHPDLFKEENKWQVSLSLLKLFDELNLHHVSISPSSDDWLATVQQAYNIEQVHPQLQQEAELVHTLWHAWHQQLQANKLVDESSAYVLRLKQAQHLPNDFYCFSLNSEQLAPCEQQFIQFLKKTNLCKEVEPLILNPDSAQAFCQQFLQQAFAYQQSPLKYRVDKFSAIKKNKDLPFSIYAAKEAEDEACIIDLQIRQWLLTGKKNIGVISEDRKLSRRLRALLERADVPVQDLSGWSLATTSAAATLERWLECIEEDFDYRPMIDLLKSHFIDLSGNDFDKAELLKNIYRLEKDIIQHEDISSGLSRYKKQLEHRSKRLQHWPENAYDKIVSLLDLLEKTAEPLAQLYHSKNNHQLDVFLETLIHSLKLLGIDQSFSKDPAGIRILQTLSDMKRSLSFSDLILSWDDFRTWLGLSLEEHMFSPQTEASPVQLMTLEQAQTRNFDVLIIAAADRQFMPGSPPSSPFFNQGVRKSLGLNIWETHSAQRLNYFQQLLINSNETLITYKSENNGEPVPASPWIEALENFHQLNFSRSLSNEILPALFKTHRSVMICDSEVLPKKYKQTSPNAPKDLQPERISAGAHQRLINCPYQFFSGDMLKLKASEEISDELKKSDYGERVHAALQAFHQQTKNLPDAFSELVTENNRQQAIDYLSDISRKIFKADLEDNVLHRSWLQRWIKHIPSYINWQISQQKIWTVQDTELALEKEADESTRIFGRLDRVDNNNNENCIIDYKTGKSASQDNVNSGENIQLTTYALLDEAATNIIYLMLDDSKNKVKEGATLSGELLESIKTEVLDRLKTLLNMIQQGAELPAWGDTATCNYCDFEGLCRKSNWQT